MGSLLNDREKFLFDERNIEVLRLAGAEDVILWSFATDPYALKDKHPSVSGDAMDCLYGEPNQALAEIVEGKQRGYYTKFPILALFEKPTDTFETSSQGSEKVTDTIIYINRKQLEKLKVPRDNDGDMIKEGDIIQLFSKDKIFSTYYEIIEAERDGFINDSVTFTQYVCDAMKSTAFAPSRKIP